MLTTACLKIGSSPLARGTRSPRIRVGLEARLIPACAGNTCTAVASRKGTAAHPRLRGEHGVRTAGSKVPSGSSPLARGTRDLCSRHPLHDGLIPACAGNTLPLLRVVLSRTAHPRLRGEHSSSIRMISAPSGSSPLARGTRLPTNPQYRAPGLIPACAGNTRSHRHSSAPTGAHPRLRGEHIASRGGLLIREGSSPLARGTLPESLKYRHDDRLIPACAGNTRYCSPSPYGPRAHPRLRGEHLPESQSRMLPRGSSPLARGTRRHRNSPPLVRRLIPACAGNTAVKTGTLSVDEAHPRLRGEHFLGSKMPALVPRLIPACAGNTVCVLPT